MMRRPRRQMNQINVVPFIDVMLVLLIVFMVAAPLINPGQIELPQVGQKLAPPVAPLEVIIRRDGHLMLRDGSGPGGEVEIGRPELVEILRQKQRQNPEQAVVISADRSVRYEQVLEVMDLLQQNQVRKVGLLAKPANR